ncbi:MAG TPA: nuclear transport factor 2 family protein [Thermoleophilaceae bacterium]|jgi:hypothetical protein
MLDRIDTYIAAWNEPDAARRRELLGQCMSPDGELIDRRGRHRGLDVLRDRIGTFHDSIPGCRVIRSTGADELAGVARHGFTVLDADGSMRTDGLNVIELADDGRLSRVMMFFGPLPDA